MPRCRMGIDLAYFAAASDVEAGEAERRPGGPLGWPHVSGTRRVGLFRKEPVMAELGPAWPGFAVRGYDPMVTMGTLEALLTERPYDEVTVDPRWGGAPSPEPAEEDRGVVSLTHTLRDALAAASDDLLLEVAGPWSRTEELRQEGGDDVEVADHVAFLRRLRELARSAVAHGHGLYCYYEL